MRSILDIDVSCFKNYNTANNPQNVNLLVWLQSNKYESLQQKIRILETKKERDKEKSKIPAITPSGTFTYRAGKNLIKHSGLIQIDIDLSGDNLKISNYKDLKQHICNIPNIAYFGLSVSGTGYWGLIPISNPEKHKEHFNALFVVFKKFGIELDDKPKNIASLRGYSFDSDAYFNHNAKVFTGLLSDAEYKRITKGTPEPPKQDKPKIKNQYSKHTLRNDNPLNICLSLIKNSVDGQKQKDLLKASQLAGGFISKGLLSESETIRELQTAILQKDINDSKIAFNTISDGIKYGKNNPIDLLIECCFVPYNRIIDYSDKSFQIFQNSKFVFIPKSQVYEIQKTGCYIKKYYLENNDSEIKPKYIESNRMSFESQSILDYSFVQSKKKQLVTPEPTKKPILKKESNYITFDDYVKNLNYTNGILMYKDDYPAIFDTTNSNDTISTKTKEFISMASKNPAILNQYVN